MAVTDTIIIVIIIRRRSIIVGTVNNVLNSRGVLLQFRSGTIPFYFLKFQTGTRAHPVSDSMDTNVSFPWCKANKA